MSIECSECERDLRGPHDHDCSRHPLNKLADDAELGKIQQQMNRELVTLNGKSWRRFCRDDAVLVLQLVNVIKHLKGRQP